MKQPRVILNGRAAPSTVCRRADNDAARKPVVVGSSCFMASAWRCLGRLGRLWRLPAVAAECRQFRHVVCAGFFSFFAWVGSFVGMMLGALIGGTIEKLLRRLGVGMAAALCVATLANSFALWQIAGLLHASFPGLRHSIDRPVTPVTTDSSSTSTCAHPPLVDSRERKSWDTEYR